MPTYRDLGNLAEAAKSDLQRLTRERDQARAECERLREVLDEVVKRLVPLTPVILAAMQAKREGE